MRPARAPAIPRIAMLYLSDENDYALALYDSARDAWVRVETPRTGDVASDRVADLIPGRWDADALVRADKQRAGRP